MDIEPKDVVTSVQNPKDGKCICTGFFLEHSADCWAELIHLNDGNCTNYFTKMESDNGN